MKYNEIKYNYRISNNIKKGKYTLGEHKATLKIIKY